MDTCYYPVWKNLFYRVLITLRVKSVMYLNKEWRIKYVFVNVNLKELTKKNKQNFESLSYMLFKQKKKVIKI